MAYEDKNEIQPELIVNKEKHKFYQGEYKLDMYDWLRDVPQIHNRKKLVEVRFKSTRKDIFENVNDIPLQIGDSVAVESSPGYDMGYVSLTGELVYQQIKKNRIQIPNEGFKKLHRLARPIDIEKWNEARALENPTMIKARQIAKKMKLNMKIGDVEFQGDKTKAIFYYIADERVDFRELIKVLAEEFKIRIEMRQIGARQEAGRIGGIGPCGKAICCSQFVGRFVSVSTQAARYQELSLNPQKLAGQCGKLKCCLNFEVDSYMDAQKDFPSTNVPLIFGGGIRATHQKTDVYKRILWYGYQKENGFQFVALSVEKVKEIIALNKAGKELEKLESDQVFEIENDEPDYENVIGQDSLTRFDNKNKKKKKPSGGNQQQRQQEQPRIIAQQDDTSVNPDGQPRPEGQQRILNRRDNQQPRGGGQPRGDGQSRREGQPRRDGQNRNDGQARGANDNRRDNRTNDNPEAAPQAQNHNQNQNQPRVPKEKVLNRDRNQQQNNTAQGGNAPVSDGQATQSPGTPSNNERNERRPNQNPNQNQNQNRGNDNRGQGGRNDNRNRDRDRNRDRGNRPPRDQQNRDQQNNERAESNESAPQGDN